MKDTSILLFFLHIAGAAALLIWSVRLVRTGVERAFAVQLRQWLRWSGTSRVLAAIIGSVSALLLQSSTAVSLMVSNFVSSGTIAFAAGLAILLGADVGSALVIQILLVRQAFLIPLLLLVGIVLFLKSSQRRVRQSGRILVGLALIFTSLDMLRSATAPLVDSQSAAAVMAYLGNDVLTAFVLGAIFTWIVHSSVATILLFVTLVAQGVLPQSAAVAMILGANLGGAFIAYVLTFSMPIKARRLIVSNLFLRGGGAALTLFALSFFEMPLDLIGDNEAQQAINLHLIFNLSLAMVALPFIGLADPLAKLIMKSHEDPSRGNGQMSALDPASLKSPDRALICAAREVLHMGETTEAMLRSITSIYEKWDGTVAGAIAADERHVHKAHFQVKLFIAKLNRGELDEEISARSMHLPSIAASIWGAAAVISPKMTNLAKRLDREGIHFSPKGRQEILDFHDHVLANVQLALNVMMTQNPDDARELIEEKESIRNIEQNLQRQHLGRLRDGLTESIETSNIHQETLRALKQINTSFSMVALPILSETGDLLDSRLSERKE